MKRLMLLVVIAAVMAVLTALSAVPVFAQGGLLGGLLGRQQHSSPQSGPGGNATPTAPVDNHGVASTPAGPIECGITNKGANSNFTTASPEQCHDMGGSVIGSG